MGLIFGPGLLGRARFFLLGLQVGVGGDLRKRPPGGLAVFSGGDFLLAGRGGQI